MIRSIFALRHKMVAVWVCAAMVLAVMMIGPGPLEAEFLVKSGEPIKHFGLRPLVTTPDTPPFFHTSNFVDDDAEQPSKLLVISFFASWCKPCKKELPLLDALYRNYKDQGLSVLGVAVDSDPAGIKEAQQYVLAAKLSFPVLSDARQLVTRQYFDENVNLPAILYIDKSGRIIAAKSGYSEGQSDDMEREIRAALGLVAVETSQKTTETPAPVAAPKQTKASQSPATPAATTAPAVKQPTPKTPPATGGKDQETSSRNHRPAVQVQHRGYAEGTRWTR